MSAPEIRIVCDKVAAHPKRHPEILVNVFRREGDRWTGNLVSIARADGSDEWQELSDNDYRGGVLRRPGITQSVNAEKQDANGWSTPYSAERSPVHLKCRKCPSPDLWISEPRMWEILEKARHAGEFELSLSQIDGILRR